MQGGIQMRRKTFDALAVIGGLVLAVVLLVAGGLLLWGHNFVNDQVHTQLAAQQVYFPPAGSPALKALPAADAKAMSQYAGQQMVNGAQAQVYADHFIRVHLSEVANGQTYAQVSSQLQPPNVSKLSAAQVTKLTGQQDTLFRGSTLRGLLLDAYAFGEMSQIMLIAAIFAFVAAGVMLIMSAFGIAHLRHVAAEAEIFSKRTAGAHAPAPAV
jgi:hypothetical protein